MLSKKISESYSKIPIANEHFIRILLSGSLISLNWILRASQLMDIIHPCLGIISWLNFVQTPNICCGSVLLQSDSDDFLIDKFIFNLVRMTGKEQ